MSQWRCSGAVSDAALCAPHSRDLSDLVTAFISSSPRKGDADLCLAALDNLLKQLRWLLPRSPLVVIFDAPSPLLAHTALSQAVGSLDYQSWFAEDGTNYTTTTGRGTAVVTRSSDAAAINATKTLHEYVDKISFVQRLAAQPAELGMLRVVVNERWLHQGNALREGMRRGNLSTPLILSVQDDIELVALNELRVGLIIERLMCDPSVEYVRLHWGTSLSGKCALSNTHPGHPVSISTRRGSAECVIAHALSHASSQLFAGGFEVRGAHAEQPGLFRLPEWSDRPHFARVETYNRYVWPLFGPAVRMLPEVALKQHPPANASEMGLWLFAPNCSMLHEKHHRCGLYRSRNPSYG